jgi:hypothetical protein
MSTKIQFPDPSICPVTGDPITWAFSVNPSEEIRLAKDHVAGCEAAIAGFRAITDKGCRDQDRNLMIAKARLARAEANAQFKGAI